MSAKPDFSVMTTLQLRDYVLEHRDDEEALHVYLDKRRSENVTSRVYKAEENVTEAIAEYFSNTSRSSP